MKQGRELAKNAAKFLVDKPHYKGYVALGPRLSEENNKKNESMNIFCDPRA